MMDSRHEPVRRPITAVPARHRPAERAAAGRQLPLRLPPLVVAMRPKQWVKNGLVFLALIFSLNESWRPLEIHSWTPLLVDAILAFLAFTAVASALYLVNDLVDIESDRLHPRKRRRPLAAGTLSPLTAKAAVGALMVAGLALSVSLGWPFLAVLAAYAVQSLAYSYYLKHMVILDVLTIAVGFVLRAIGGALAIGVPISPWLYSVTLLGALFIAIAKRRAELLLLDAGATDHRPILAEYTTGMLDQMASVVTSSTVIAYSLYTFTAENLPENHAMMATVPFVLYGIFRYMYLIHRREEGGSPEELLLRDRPLLIDVILWLLTSMGILVLFR
jgi:4-hydroxybenzoate polyprenyltransferase